LRQAVAQTNPLALRRLELAALARLDQIRQENERLLRRENGGSQGQILYFEALRGAQATGIFKTI
jgi:hypothetical protein